MLATLGDIYLNRNQPDEAISCYDVAFAIEDPSVSRLLRAIEGLLMAGDVRRVGDLIKKAESIQSEKTDAFEPKQGRTLLNLKAERAQQQGNKSTAISIYSKLLREDPLDGKILIMLGDLHREERQLEDAIMIYERAARISGYEARALTRQAQVEIEREQYERAVELLETAQSFEEQQHVSRYLEQLRNMIR